MILTTEFESYLSNTMLSDRTVRAYSGGVRHFASLFDEVNTPNIRVYRNICLKTQKPKTVNLRLNALKKYAKWRSLKVDISLVEIQEPLFVENPLSTSDYNKILSYLKNTGQIQWYVLIRTLACTGVRIGESRQLTVGDLRQGRKTIIGKGTKSRVIWFPIKYRQEMLPMLQGKSKNDPLVSYSEDYIREKLRKLQKQLGIKCHLTPHEFRRFYARQVYSRTKDIYLVRDLLGHSSIKTTMHYLKISASNISKRMSHIVDW